MRIKAEQTDMKPPAKIPPPPPESWRGADRVLQREVPGAAGQPHIVLPGAGRFIQEDRGPELARIVADFIARTP
jgi:pimeloyl-ACP methyl ester carboxylesterase